jgi:hypothetical protein
MTQSMFALAYGYLMARILPWREELSSLRGGSLERSIRNTINSFVRELFT